MGDKLPVHGEGHALRSFLYVTDVADAFDVILHRGSVGEVYNIGTAAERTALEVAQNICGLFGLDVNVAVVHVPDRLFNDRRRPPALPTLPTLSSGLELVFRDCLLSPCTPITMTLQVFHRRV